ncbi:hypothetical protein OS175_12710 [Marinicella sp. S1101]|uniref:hypothetical protein n=1 Tax=Marinicella marina TaxID=2996016 RepID=UPI0022609F47|nr:hypothetical protein [Marinicella marina]MCX7554735.1 hypothetical protein [Marinicella marina]MDJ1141449.1 hypothetical protein [Marinicella marina]
MKKIFCIGLFLISVLLQAQTRPADGLWTTEDDPAIGSGLMLTTQNGVTLISVFSYDDSGQNVWYIGSGVVDEAGVLEVELSQTENGQNLLLDNPQAAFFANETSSLRLEFQGSQLATMQIDESEQKNIQANHFGTTSTFDFPDLTGKWVLANKNIGDSYLLNFGEAQLNPGSIGALPFLDVSFVSSHPSTQNWQMECVVISDQSSPSSCKLVNTIEDIQDLFVSASDIGTNVLTLKSFGGEPKYQAFRLKNDRRLQPNDGHWRPADDPKNGSGLVLRTQGEYTVVIIYSYDENGKPKWQNAAGQFDENGLMVAELVSPNNGTAIESETPQSAAFEGQPQTLEIQLEGLELATFSIDGSEPKYMQNYNFGVELFETKIFQPTLKPYAFPAQFGQWVLVDTERSISSVWNIFADYPNGCQSPPNPMYFDSVVYSNGFSCSPRPEPIFENQYFNVSINCIKSFVPVPGLVYPDYDFCYGTSFSANENERNLKINFSDMGFKKFRFYTGTTDDSISYFDSFFDIDRSSPMFQLFRLE